MFTGIITDVGQIRRVAQAGDLRVEIETAYDAADIAIGASIACDGVCLTVVAKGSEPAGQNWFAVDVSAETISKTNAGRWKPGARVNLERALRIGDELGGHIVSGHVDGKATVEAVTPEGDSRRIRFRVPDALKKYIAPKGSIAVDGVSLTVNEVEDAVFGVNIIPHTAAVTTLGALKAGDPVNIEIDLLARYVARLQAA